MKKYQKRWTCLGCGRHLGIVFHDPVLDKDMVRLMITLYDNPGDVANRHLIEVGLPAECTCECGTHNEVHSIEDCQGEEV